MRERHVPPEAVELTVRRPDAELILHAGRWNERTRSRRRFGDRELHVVWTCDGRILILAVWWRRLGRKGTR